jgi:hypothetical protein
MRWSALLTIAASLAALILSLLCLFAGSTRTFLQSADIMTLNISQIGRADLFNTTSDADDNFLDDLVNAAQDEVNDLIGDAAEELTQRLNISDFYVVHVMNYCQGMFEPNGTVKGAKRNVTECSKRNAAARFDPGETIQEHLPDGITLEDLQWPSEIDDASRGLRVLSVAMFAFWCIGIGFAGLTLITAAVTLFTGGRLTACGVFLLSVVSWSSCW